MQRGRAPAFQPGVDGERRHAARDRGPPAARSRRGGAAARRSRMEDRRQRRGRRHRAGRPEGRRAPHFHRNADAARGDAGVRRIARPAASRCGARRQGLRRPHSCPASLTATLVRSTPMKKSDAVPKADGQLRRAAESVHADEIAALVAEDVRPRPAQWRLSPQAVVTYLMGGKTRSGVEITAKYIGNRRLIETAVATLATDRALLILGGPGTAKSWVSEHLAAAISGSSELIVQCTAGTDENQIRYGWNYAQLLAKGPSRDALVATPLMRAMEGGQLVRFEELTRMSSDVQDTLITVLSEKMLPIPEINDAVHARRGFNMIATANNRDKGVNDLSSALKRRFNVVVLPMPASLGEEEAIVVKRGGEIGSGL